MTNSESESRPIVVGIGASAGGLEALQEFFEHVPADLNAAYVVVQHLSPDFKSLMDEILKRHTRLEICRVEDREPIVGRKIYLTPPRVDIRIDGDSLRVDPQATKRSVQHPINVFFQSMAKTCERSCVAIVLSGTGTDGAIGVRAVKESGGVVLVQDPDTARFDGMPRAATGTGVVDFTLTPDKLASKTAHIIQHAISVDGRLASEGETDQTPHFETILDLVEGETSLHLKSYKPGTISRRIDRRMSIHNIETPEAYVRRLREDPEECRALARDCLIHVTRFFRDADAFELVNEQITKAVAEHENPEQPFRIWIVGCSTGEEAYSIAILMDKAIRKVNVGLDYKIFATDLDADAVESASMGRFVQGGTLGLEDDVAAEYFTVDGETLIAGPRLRNKMVFARHNVLTDPPFPKANLVVCRNLLIYLRPVAQKSVLERLNFSLVRGGTLFLGPSEVLESLASDYNVIDAKWRVFQKLMDRPYGSISTLPFERSGGAKRREPQLRATKGHEVRQFELTRACQALIDNFALCGVVIDGSDELVYSFGDVSRFLRFPSGGITTRIEELLPPAAIAATMVAVRQSRASNATVRVEGVQVDDDDSGYAVDVVHLPASDEGSALSILIVGKTMAGTSPRSITAIADIDGAAKEQLQVLEVELKTTRQSLQATIEELESTNEEMQSVNEELLSSNEELQSTNEELHSVNEELYTVNAEHQSKITELADVTEDLENLLQATRIGMVFVDSDMRIRRFTPDARIGLPLRDSDVGRGLAEISSRMELDLTAIVKKVLREGDPWENRVNTDDGTPVLVAVRPHGTTHTEHAGCVITIVDLTMQETAIGERRSLTGLAESLEHVKTTVFWVREVETGRYHYLSPSFAKIWGTPTKDCFEDPIHWRERIHQDDLRRVEAQVTMPSEQDLHPVEYRIVREDGSIVWIEDRACGGFDTESGGRMVCGFATDQTGRVQKDSEARAQTEVMRRALERASVCVALLRGGDKILWANSMARNQLRRNDRILDKLGALVLDKAMRKELSDAVEELSNSIGGTTSLDISLDTSDRGRVATELSLESIAHGDNGNDATILVQWSDRTQERQVESELRQQNQRLEVAAHTDPLTGLLNRRGLDQALREDLFLCNRSGDGVMVLLIDCDKFKEINDQHSHTDGDQVLREIAERLRKELRPTDALGRIGGDEFVVVLPATRIAEGAHVAEKLRRAICTEAIHLDGKRLEVTISVGVASAAPNATQVSDLIADADQLLQRSKLRGRNKVSFLSVHLDESDEVEQDLVDSLLAEGGVTTALQAINSVATGEVVGYELLARAVKSTRNPHDFFALARTTGQLEALDLRCLEVCMTRIAHMDDALRCHVNIFPSTLLASDSTRLDEILSMAKDPSKICLELSEQQFVGPSTPLRDRLGEIRGRGFKIALDDVGFGRSALESLLAVDPDVIKVDRSLVNAIDGGSSKRRPFAQLFSMMGGLSAEVIAEGVERKSQQEVLRDLGVEFAQGYLWSRPEVN